MLFSCFLTYASYNRISNIVETMPQYAERIHDVIKPLNQKIAKVQETAGNLNPEAPQKNC